MAEFCVFEPEHFDARFMPPSAPHSTPGEYVYVGYLASGSPIAYYHNTCCRVLDIGGSSGPAPFTRLNNNKLREFGLVANAFTNGRCSRGRVSYRIVNEFQDPLGVPIAHQFENLEMALQFLFGFSSGSLPFTNNVEAGGSRWAPYSDLWRIADANRHGAIVWDTVFPGANHPFLTRLISLLEEIHPYGPTQTMGGTVPDIAHLNLSGGRFTHPSCRLAPVFDEVCFTRAHVPTAAAKAGHSQNSAGTAQVAKILNPLVQWIDQKL